MALAQPKQLGGRAIYPALISLTGACWLPGLAEHQGKILVVR